ncbi:ariadne ring protein [Pyrenophora teres f. maculata]|nr:ariadne ring protein [Pyrenophora teres f. maculata]
MAEPDIQRHIEGANASFIAGCVISRISLDSSVRITNKLSVKADANTILLSWRPISGLGFGIVQEILHSIAGALRFCHRSNQDIRGRWNTSTLAGFYQPEHALEAIKHFNGLPHVDVHLIYNLYFTAPRHLSDAVLADVRDVMSQVPDVNAVWEESRNDMVTLRLSGVNQQQAVDLKRILEALFAGHIATSRDLNPVIKGELDIETAEKLGPTTQQEIWHDFFRTASGAIWLQHLARDYGINIMSDKLQQRLRIYDPLEDEKVVEEVEHQLAKKVFLLNGSKESHVIHFGKNDFQELLASGKVLRAQSTLGTSRVNLDILKKALVLHCPRVDALLLASQLNLPLTQLEHTTTITTTCSQCEYTTDQIKFSACNHFICRDCFNNQIHISISDLTGNYFPLVCWHADCETPIVLSDIQRNTTGVTFDALLNASLTRHIRSYPDLYRNCRTPNCKSVYFRDGSYEIFTCPTCLTQTCTRCNLQAHATWTCERYKAHLRKTRRNEKLLDDYKAFAGTKECPKCATLIEKVDGCHHVECSGCHTHMCWECSRVFPRSDIVYQHMNEAHGGNGLVDGEDGDSDEESGEDSDEWENEE